MSVPIRRAKASDVVAAEPVVVGKDVIELLSTAMYVDPLTIYREYVQNAADAVDKARASGRRAGNIEITLDAAARSVAIRDDAAGVPSSKFRRVLTSVGASAKRGTQARGFRGVGRLSGLAYARSVTFQSRAAGERRVSTMTWNCQALRSALRNPEDTRDLASIIDAITTITVTEEAGDPFFEVKLDSVMRQGDDRIMSQQSVGDYLAEVAPVPLDKDFASAALISEKLASRVALGELSITINGGEPLTRPFRNEVPVEGGRPLRLREVAFVEVPSVDGGVGAMGWIAHHDYEGAIHPTTQVRGLRVRVGDMQVGEAGVLADIFPETRFDAWTVGEIHVLDSRIIPNARRDDFERNVHFANLKNNLAPLGRDVANRCRTSSRNRKRLRDIELEQASAREAIAVLGQGSLGSTERKRVARTADLSLMRAEKLIGPPDLVDDTGSHARSQIADLRAELKQVSRHDAPLTSPLQRLSPKRRAFFEEMFALIYENAQNRSAAKSLIDRILSKIN